MYEKFDCSALLQLSFKNCTLFSALVKHTYVNETTQNSECTRFEFVTEYNATHDAQLSILTPLVAIQ